MTRVVVVSSCTVLAVNNYDRDVTPLEFDLVEPFYRHLRTLTALIDDPDNSLWLQLRPGTVIFIHNVRVMHGRSGFTASSGRTLSGCYVNNEEFHSRLRAVHAKLSVAE